MGAQLLIRLGFPLRGSCQRKLTDEVCHVAQPQWQVRRCAPLLMSHATLHSHNGGAVVTPTAHRGERFFVLLFAQKYQKRPSFLVRKLVKELSVEKIGLPMIRADIAKMQAE